MRTRNRHRGLLVRRGQGFFDHIIHCHIPRTGCGWVGLVGVADAVNDGIGLALAEV